MLHASARARHRPPSLLLAGLLAVLAPASQAATTVPRETPRWVASARVEGRASPGATTAYPIRRRSSEAR